MALNKKEEFELEYQVLAEFAKALSHPARVAILETIAEKKECICGEIVEVLPLAQSTVSQHLKALKESGLISGEIEGPRSCYCLNEDAIQKFEEVLLPFIKRLKKSKKKGVCS